MKDIINDYGIAQNIEMYIIIGESRARKSSTLRCLTGIRDCDTYEIERVCNGALTTYIKTSSVQEKGMNEIEIVNELIQAYNEKKFDCALLCLRIRPKITNGKTYNDSDSYIQYFINKGFNIKQIVYLRNSNDNNKGINISGGNSLNNGEVIAYGPRHNNLTVSYNKKTLKYIPDYIIQNTEKMPTNKICRYIRGWFGWL